GTTGGGDGWDIATYNNRVYNVFHHQNYFGLMCHNQSDASNCWTTTDTGTSNLFKTITVGGNAFGTSGKVGLYVDQSTGYLYVYATQVSNLQTGVVCINLNAADTVPNPTCTGTNGEPPAFTPLAAAGTTGWTTGNPYTGTITPTYYQGKLYAWSPVNGQTAAAGGGGAAGSGHNTLLCYDITTQSACANEPFAVSVGTTAGTNGDGSPAQPTTLVGSEMFIPSVWGGGPVVACVDLSLSTPGNCAGTWPQSMGVGPSSMVTPLLDSAGNSIGVCALNSSSTWLCWGLDGSIQPTPTGLTASVLTAWQWTGSPVVVGTRVFEISGLGGSNPGLVYCYDFATNAARLAHQAQLHELLAPRLASRDVAQWLALFDEAGVPAGQIKSIDQVYATEQVRQQGLVWSAEHATLGPIELPGSPLRLARSPVSIRIAPPTLGEHSVQV
ncbi:MAG: hypothetical protein B7X10_03510, partial [Burkholderiales bacterium 21-58-4]